MKRFIACILVAGLSAGIALAQDNFGGAQAQRIKEKAKGIRDANNAAQGVPATPPPAPAAPGAPQAPAAARGIDPAQQQKVDKLQGDLTSIKPGTPVTDEQKKLLQDDLATLARGATKPSKEALAKLAGDLSAALAGKNVSLKDPSQLARALNVVMNNGNLTAAQAQSFVTAAQNALKSGGAGETEIQAVATGLKAIVTELQKGKSHLYQ